MPIVNKSPHPIVLDFIQQNYTYDSSTGKIQYNNKIVGRSNKRKYIEITIKVISDRYLVLQSRCNSHQIAWYLTYGYWPIDKFIDHIDGDPSNNRISNLRLATRNQNARNQKKNINSDNTSKYKGVSLLRGNRWVAKIAFDGKNRGIGTYDTEREAALAYNVRAFELFGEFARLNIIGE